MANIVKAQTSIAKEELSWLWQVDDSLKKVSDLKEVLKNRGFKVKYEKRWGLFYWIRNQIDGIW